MGEGGHFSDMSSNFLCDAARFHPQGLRRLFNRVTYQKQSGNLAHTIWHSVQVSERLSCCHVFSLVTVRICSTADLKGCRPFTSPGYT
jgi:hypothetical protein